MQVTTGQLTILNAHTGTPGVYWNGAQVPNIKAISTSFDGTTGRVTITVPEDPVLAEMKAAGIVIKREAV